MLPSLQIGTLKEKLQMQILKKQLLQRKKPNARTKKIQGIKNYCFYGSLQPSWDIIGELQQETKIVNTSQKDLQ